MFWNGPPSALFGFTAHFRWVVIRSKTAWRFLFNRQIRNLSANVLERTPTHLAPSHIIGRFCLRKPCAARWRGPGNPLRNICRKASYSSIERSRQAVSQGITGRPRALVMTQAPGSGYALPIPCLYDLSCSCFPRLCRPQQRPQCRRPHRLLQEAETA